MLNGGYKEKLLPHKDSQLPKETVLSPFLEVMETQQHRADLLSEP